MGKISLTADGRNVSTRDRIHIAASVTNALGVDLAKTNINKTSFWRNWQKMRLKKAEDIGQDFKCPEKVVIHWDGKTLSLRGRIESKRVCVYLSGVNAEKVRKLLGIPETSSGKGVDEFELVKDLMMKWKIKNQTIGMVFDTTNSNSGEHNGACKYLEIWVGKPVLWLACRRHIIELHAGAYVKVVTGATKDHGVALFRRLRDQWYTLDINLSNLELFDQSSVSPDLQREAVEVLAWAEEELRKNTFPRDDWREFMELIVVSLGGHVEGFCVKLPGPDHHARWMSKCIYFLKIRLLSRVFPLSTDEKWQADQMAQFVLLMYAKLWFTSSLASAAARSDLTFMCLVHDYRKVHAKGAWEVLRSVYRHMWYITPQLLPLALTDMELDDLSKEAIARALYSKERIVISTGKPTFPILAYGPSAARLDMGSLVSSESWLVFDLLEMTGKQDWLTSPAATWDQSADFLILKEFSLHLVVVNDLAEQGIHLATDYVNRVGSEEQ